MKPALATIVIALALTGCASRDEGDGRRGHPDHDHPPAPSASLFISPSGQPFRAPPGEAYPVGLWFAQADRNSDGRLDRAEFRADAEAFFRRLDQNHDGVIDGFEVNDYELHIAPEITGAYGSEGGRRRRGGEDGRPDRGGGAGSVAVLQGAAVFGLLNEPEPVTAADRSLDGHITLAEFLSAADRRFDQLDAKHFGYLTLDALPKAPAQAMMDSARPGQRHREHATSDQPTDK